MKARFNKVKNRYTNKFSFDNNTTLGIGNVQPLFCKQMCSGSKISVNFNQLTRLSPLVVPTFARLKQHQVLKNYQLQFEQHQELKNYHE